MSDNPLPDNWDGAVRWFLGGTIVFALGFEGVTMFLGGKFLVSVGSLLLAMGLLAFLVYWPAGGGLILLLAGMPVLLSLATVEFCKRRKFRNQTLVTIGIGLMLCAVVLATIGGALVYVSTINQSEAKASAAQSSSSSVPDLAPRVMELESKLATRDQELQNAKTQLEIARQELSIQSSIPALSPRPSPPLAAPTIPAVSQRTPKPHYSKAEIELMQESLRHLRALFEVKDSAPNKTVYDLVAVTMLHGPIGTMPRPSEAAEVVDNLEQYLMQLDKDEQTIKRILREAEAKLIDQEIIPTVADDKQAIQVFREAIYGIMPILRELSKIKDQINSSAFGMREREKLSHSYSAYNQWVQDSINRIKSKANELRELQP